MLPDGFENFVQIVKNFFISKPDYSDIQLVNQHCPEFIIVCLLREIMFRSVKFDYKTEFMTIEINDKAV